MWFKEYRDYKTDHPLIKEPVEPGNGIIGCEMHDLNGWGVLHHHPRPSKTSLWGRIMRHLIPHNENKHEGHREHS